MNLTYDTGRCDDSNIINGDGCSKEGFIEEGWECTYDVVSMCSEIHNDGLIVGLEQCDDKNGIDDDGCSNESKITYGFVCEGEANSTCKEVCGNGIKTPSEKCDDGNNDA